MMTEMLDSTGRKSLSSSNRWQICNETRYAYPYTTLD